MRLTIELPLRAVVFDLDNTLVRCAPTDDVVLETISRYGTIGAEADLLEHIGDASSDWAIVEEYVAPEHRHAAYLRILEANARLAKTATCADGLGEVLRALSRNYALFVASGRDRASINIVLEAVGLRQLFTDIEATSACSPCKPDARVLTYLLDRHLLTPAEAVYVGDKDVDRELASRAGAAFIGAALYHDLLPDSVRKVRSAAEIPHAINDLAAQRETTLSLPIG
jgi:HAD superfamily hydrolase (TIGR01549 family)